METVGKFYDYHPNVIDHRKNHLAYVLRLTRFRSQHVQAADLCDALDKAGCFVPKTLLNASHGEFRVFDYVVQERCGKGGGVHAHVRQDVGHFQQVREIRVAGTAQLVAVTFSRYLICTADEPRIVRRTVFLELVQKLVQASVQQALGTIAVEVERQIGRPGHLPMLRLKKRKGERGDDSREKAGHRLMPRNKSIYY